MVFGTTAATNRLADLTSNCASWAKLRENVRARKVRRIVFSVVLSRQPSPALLFFKLIEVETKFLFANSISEFSRGQDPTRTLGSVILTEWFVPCPGQYEVFWMGVGWCSLLRAALRDGTCRRLRLEVNGQRGMPSAGIALSIKPTVLLRRSLTEHSPCARAHGRYRSRI